MSTTRLTVGQATVRFLAAQWSERDGIEHRLIEGCFGILGHGNVAGLGEGLLEAELLEPGELRYFQARNEQAMVHAAVAFARMRNRMSTLACLTSIGPGATNMVTGAALATISRLPVLLLPADSFATRVSDPVLQQLELQGANDVSVNDAFRPVSKFFDRVQRPEQLPSALLGAMRVLTDPAETGAATVCVPEDVQAEAFDWPSELFELRTWHVSRPVPDPASMRRAGAALRRARRPLLVAGGGVIYSEATEALRRLAEATGIPVAETQAGKGALRFDHPAALGGLGSTGSSAANAIARRADVVVGVGTRWTDFSTASRTAFCAPDVRIVNCNITSFDAAKLSGLMVVGDAREALEALARELEGWSVDDDYRAESAALAGEWDRAVGRAYATRHEPLPSQAEVIGAVNELSGPRDVVVCAAGSMPGDLHKLWRTRDIKGYQVEYGYSCMGYEIAGGLGAKMAAPDREVCVMVGDGSYLMMAQELVTAVQERVKLTIVLVENHGFGSIGELSEAVGSQRFGTRFRMRSAETGRLDGAALPVDLAENAESLGATVFRTHGIDEFTEAFATARHVPGPVVLHIEVDPLIESPSSDSWWDVPIGEVSRLASATAARGAYETHRARRRWFL